MWYLFASTCCVAEDDLEPFVLLTLTESWDYRHTVQFCLASGALLILKTIMHSWISYGIKVVGGDMKTRYNSMRM